MSSEKKYTERDKVLFQREGYERAKNASGLLTPYGIECARIEAVAAYPLPKRVQPRVVKDSQGHEWRVVDGVLQYVEHRGGPWVSVQPYMNPEFAGVIVGLFAYPTEKVDDV